MSNNNQHTPPTTMVTNPFKCHTLIAIPGVNVPGITSPDTEHMYTPPGLIRPTLAIPQQHPRTLAFVNLLSLLDEPKNRINALESKCYWARLWSNPKTYSKASVLADVAKLQKFIAPLARASKKSIPRVRQFFNALETVMYEMKTMYMRDQGFHRETACIRTYFPKECPVAALCYLMGRIHTAATEIEKLLKGHDVLVQWHKDRFMLLERDVESRQDRLLGNKENKQIDEMEDAEEDRAEDADTGA
ncbi:hypothetical protein K458DRAFT_394401 [Lentithecium fluviatile CBS 122367]|uniref:Uncharacterized protein n=1 Tax=Lentithecium fluviatile CBS 122367 TaxID=1168545 RepID=A0A6G1IL95_9PLEO|nr:hypothetical protein K458DRAFT_394401 [Lentithecium fluviatile CBS 122367]